MRDLPDMPLPWNGGGLLLALLLLGVAWLGWAATRQSDGGRR